MTALDPPIRKSPKVRGFDVSARPRLSWAFAVGRGECAPVPAVVATVSSRENEIPGLGRRTDPIRVVRGVDPARLKLSPEEAALLARLGGETTLGELLQRSGLPEARAIGALLALRSRGVVEARDGGARETGRYVGFVFNLLELNEEGVDLDVDRRKEVLFLFARIGKVSHYDLLGVPPGADAGRVKEAYFELSKRFHPDRFFQKRLGSYKPKLDAVFKALVEAEKTLVDPALRRAYEAKLKAADPAAQKRDAEEAAIDEARAAERRARMLKRSPLMKRLGTAGEFAKRGREAYDKALWSQAAADLATAASLDPKNEELGRLAAEAKRKADLERAEEVLHKADFAATSGDAYAAFEYAKQAVEVAPRSAKVLKKALALWLDAGREAQEAREVAARLVELMPNDADAHALYGRALIQSGQEKTGKKALERALELNPHQAYARSVLKKFWPF